MFNYHYSELFLLLGLNELLLTIPCLLFLTFTGFYPTLWLFLRKKIPNKTLSKIVYVFFFPFFGLVLLPSYFIRTYYLPKVSGLLKQTFAEWLMNFLWENLLGFFIATILVFLLYWTIERFPKKWWLVSGGVVVVAHMVIVNFFPRLVLGEAKKTEINSGVYFSEIKQLVPNQKIRLFKLIDEKNIHMLLSSAFDVYIIDTPQEKRFYLGSGMFDKFSKKEIISLLAHEVSHVLPHSKLYSNLTMGALIILSFYLAYLLILLSLKYFNARLRIEKLQEPSSLGLIMLAFFASFTLFFLPASNAFSRYQEKQADLCSVCLTRNKEAIISALKKLYHFNGIDPEPGVIIKIFFEDHPSLQERINYIESFLLPKANNKQ